MDSLVRHYNFYFFWNLENYFCDNQFVWRVFKDSFWNNYKLALNYRILFDLICPHSKAQFVTVLKFVEILIHNL